MSSASHSTILRSSESGIRCAVADDSRLQGRHAETYISSSCPSTQDYALPAVDVAGVEAAGGAEGVLAQVQPWDQQRLQQGTHHRACDLCVTAAAVRFKAPRPPSEIALLTINGGNAATRVQSWVHMRNRTWASM